ncbi:MAG: M15 family metallopeptidase [Bacteroidales bacterium]
MGKNKNENKKQKALIIIIIILALLLIGSRTCRLNRRNLNSDQHNLTSETTHQKSQDSLLTQNEEPMPELPQPDKNILLGKLSTSQKDSLLSPIENKYANRSGMYMHKKAYNAFINMHDDAKKDGIELTIVSAFRDFDHQNRIWENKWTGRQVLSGNIFATEIPDAEKRALEILKFSAMPGTSRHHWGTDIDLNSLNNSYFASGQGRQEYEWLVEHAHKYGFCQPYTRKNEDRPSGYEEEKWHWSYKPVSSVYLKHFKELVNYNDLTGFEGHETAHQLRVIENYVSNVNQQCLNQ